MKAIKIVMVFVLSLGLAVSSYGDTQTQKTTKPAQKQVKQDNNGQKSGLKKVFRNPFKRQPKSQEADCRKFPSAPGCPDARQAKQMEKQVNPPAQKAAQQGKPVQKQAVKQAKKPSKKSAKKPVKKSAKKNVKSGKKPVKKAGVAPKPQVQAKN